MTLAGLQAGLLNQSSAQVIDGSLKFDKTAETYLTRTPGSAGNRKEWTLSYWIKFYGDIGAHLFSANNDAFQLELRSGGQLLFANSGSTSSNTTSTAKFRDYGQFYHVVISHDAANTIARFYINGEQNFTATLSNADGTWNNATSHNISGRSTSIDSFGSFGMTQCYFIDGQALGPSYFGFTDPLTGVWRPKLLKDGDQATPNTHLLYNVNTSDNGFDSSSTSRTYDVTSREFSTYTTPQTANPGGFGANSAHVYKSPTGSAIKWLVSTDTSDRYIWTSEDGVNWTSKGSFYDTDGSTQSVTSTYIALAGGSNASNVTVTSAVVDFGTNGFYLPMDGNSPIGKDQSGNGNDWTPVNFGGSNSIEKATGALPILNTLGGTVARPGVFGSEESSTIAVTVSDATGSNKYYLDGVLNPTLPFIRGATITFDTTDSSNDSHPFKLSSTNADSSGGTEYTDGVVYYINGSIVSGSAYQSNYSSGASSGFRGIKWTIPHNVSTTYYYCTAHSGMGENGRLTSTTDETKADPYAWKNVLALPLVGSSTDVSNQINSGSTTKTVTENTAAASSAQRNFYGGSYYFNGSSTLALSDLNGGTNIADFTFESWIYLSNTSSQIGFFSNQTSDNAANTMRIGNMGGSPYNKIWMKIGSSSLQPSATIGAGKWFHLAVTRSGSTVTIFIDGVSAGTMSTSEAISPSGFYLGVAYPTTTFRMNGYMQDVRFYTSAKYTSNFIPASTKPDILPDTPSGVSGSSKLTKITEGAVSFDGSGDYLSGFGGSAILPTSTGTAFVVDFFWYSNGNSTQKGIWEQHSSGSGRTAYFVNNGSAYLISEGNTVGTFTYGDKRWYFTRIIYDGSGNIYHYVDGVLIGSGTQSNGVDNTGFQIGAFSTDSFNGHISNFRIVVGSNSLSGTDVPTSPLTNITNTTLLCCQSPTSATEAAVTPGSITANGDSSSTNFNPFTTNINTVRGQETSHATFNPLWNIGGTTPVARYSEGNLRAQGHSTTNNANAISTLGASSGKWYFEVEMINLQEAIAVTVTNHDRSIIRQVQRVWDRAYAEYYDGSSWTNLGSGTQYTDGDIVGVAADIDNGKVSFYKNGISIKTDGTFTPGGDTFYFGCGQIYNPSDEVRINFGQKPFEFPPPDGFQPLNDSNVRPSTVIALPDKYVAATTYAGNSGTKTVNAGHKPDFVWIKKRDATASHFLYDTVRGFSNGNAYELRSQALNAQGVPGTADTGLTSFDNNGFTLGSDGGANSSNNFIAWTWKAGGNKNTFNVDDVGYANASDVGMAAGDQNSSAYNTSQVWSNYLTRNDTGQSWVRQTEMFSGSISDNSTVAGGFYFEPPSDFTGITSLRVYMSIPSDGYTITLNDNTTKTGTGAFSAGWNDLSSEISTEGGTLSKINFVRNGSGGNVYPYIYALEIDGVILVDNGTTPPNAPSIPTTGCSVGTRQGFSILKYTGSGSNGTIAHGLSQAPDFFFGRDLDDTSSSRDWIIYHKSIGATGRLKFTTAATSTSSAFFQDTPPTNSLITVGTSNDINSTNDYVLYCWHDVPGLQKFGNYLSQGGYDANYVYLGFRPAILWIKSHVHVADTTSWCIFTDEIDKTNPFHNPLYANNTAEEGKRGNNVNTGTYDIDLLSDGFKIRTNVGEINEGGSGNYYLYCAWAKAPSIGLYGSQSNSR